MARFAEFRPTFSSSFELDPDLEVRLLDTAYGGRALARAFLRKMRRRLLSKRRGLEPVAVYDGMVVFDLPGLDGGGSVYAQIIPRVILGLGLAPVEHLYEFCAGPGYIGFSLLSYGFCRRLTLSDINPDAAAAASSTAQVNGVEHLVAVLVSDGLEQIPSGQQWDLVIGTPPLVLAAHESPSPLANRPGWGIQRDFYRGVASQMRRGGHVLMLENSERSDRAVFEPMIAAGGGEIVEVVQGRDVPGGEADKYFILSRW